MNNAKQIVEGYIEKVNYSTLGHRMVFYNFNDSNNVSHKGKGLIAIYNGDDALGIVWKKFFAFRKKKPISIVYDTDDPSDNKIYIEKGGLIYNFENE